MQLITLIGLNKFPIHNTSCFIFAEGVKQKFLFIFAERYISFSYKNYPTEYFEDKKFTIRIGAFAEAYEIFDIVVVVVVVVVVVWFYN